MPPIGKGTGSTPVCVSCFFSFSFFFGQQQTVQMQICPSSFVQLYIYFLCFFNTIQNISVVHITIWIFRCLFATIRIHIVEWSPPGTEYMICYKKAGTCYLVSPIGKVGCKHWECNVHQLAYSVAVFITAGRLLASQLTQQQVRVIRFQWSFILSYTLDIMYNI